MSRTDKDRPRWVLLNDFTMAKHFVYHHHHLQFGKVEYSETHNCGIEYLAYCTALVSTPKRASKYSNVYQFEDGSPYMVFPCYREDAWWTYDIWRSPWVSSLRRRKNKSVRRHVKEFLRKEANCYNSGYMDGDDYFMDEHVFITRYGMERQE